MNEPRRSDGMVALDDEDEARRRERRVLAALLVPLLGTGIGFRVMYLSSIPGVSGDEGWWGVQALAWLSGRPHQAQTTSGNPIDLFFLIPVALVHAAAPPSFLLLRAVPVLANVLALPAGFWFTRRLYGPTTAWIFTVALAIMPTAIAHSRICQDPSQSILWTSMVIFLSLLAYKERGRARIYASAALAAFAVALWTHPTNVFAGAFLLVALFAAARPLLPASARGRTLLLSSVALASVALAIAAGPVLSRLASANPYLARSLSGAVARTIDGAQWFEFLANNARLFNGVTVYHYFAGARPATAPYDAAFVLITVLLLWGVVARTRATGDRVDAALIAACAIMWIGFYAFAGPKALRPHAERWGLCLIAPATLVLSRGLAAWLERPKTRRITIAAATLVAASVLGSFYLNYFRVFLTVGGRSHLAYVTAAREPKQQALERILGTSAPTERVTIVTRQWWLYWPMAYLAAPHARVTVRAAFAERPQDEDLRDAIHGGRVFFVEFVGTPELAAAADWIGTHGLTASRSTIRDASGADLLEILQVSPR